MATYDPTYICDDRPEQYQISPEVMAMTDEEVSEEFYKRFGHYPYEEEDK